MPIFVRTGGVFAAQALTSASHASSRHIGSSSAAVTAAGELGKQVHPLVPARSSVGAPPSVAGQSMMVASAAIEAGAADIASLILASGVPGAGIDSAAGADSSWGAGCSVAQAVAVASTAAAMIHRSRIVDLSLFRDGFSATRACCGGSAAAGSRSGRRSGVEGGGPPVRSRAGGAGSSGQPVWAACMDLRFEATTKYCGPAAGSPARVARTGARNPARTCAVTAV